MGMNETTYITVEEWIKWKARWTIRLLLLAGSVILVAIGGIVALSLSHQRNDRSSCERVNDTVNALRNLIAVSVEPPARDVVLARFDEEVPLEDCSET